MVTMRAFCICVFVATLIHNSLGVNNKLYVKFTTEQEDPNHTKGFYELPRSLNNPSNNDGCWNIVEDRRCQDGVAVACRNNDYRVCLIVDQKNSVAGLQISSAVADLQQSGAPVRPQVERKIVLGTDVYAATMMFVGDDVLKAGGRDMTEYTETAPNGIYIKTKNDLVTVPNQEKDIVGSEWVKQECFSRMGRHYFYNISKESDCATLDTHFALYNEQSHDLTGAGYIFYGNATMQENGREWYEYFSGHIVPIIAPNSPDCFKEYTIRYGAHSLHVYFNSEPWDLKCYTLRDD